MCASPNVDESTSEIFIFEVTEQHENCLCVPKSCFCVTAAKSILLQRVWLLVFASHKASPRIQSRAYVGMKDLVSRSMSTCC
jgi:hypothetical protein